VPFIGFSKDVPKLLSKSTFEKTVVATVVFLKNLKFFLLKFNMICMFWIVLMC